MNKASRQQWLPQSLWEQLCGMRSHYCTHVVYSTLYSCIKMTYFLRGTFRKRFGKEVILWYSSYIVSVTVGTGSVLWILFKMHLSILWVYLMVHNKVVISFLTGMSKRCGQRRHIQGHLLSVLPTGRSVHLWILPTISSYIYSHVHVSYSTVPSCLKKAIMVV